MCNKGKYQYYTSLVNGVNESFLCLVNFFCDFSFILCAFNLVVSENCTHTQLTANLRALIYSYSISLQKELDIFLQAFLFSQCVYCHTYHLNDVQQKKR